MRLFFLRKKISFLHNRYHDAKFNRNINNYSWIMIWNFYQFDFNQFFNMLFNNSRKLLKKFFWHKLICFHDHCLNIFFDTYVFVIFYCFSNDSFDKLMLLKKHFNVVFFLTTFVFCYSIFKSQRQKYETHMNSIFSRNYSLKTL